MIPDRNDFGGSTNVSRPIAVPSGKRRRPRPCTVGFAGNGQRYTLAVMNDLGGAGGYDDGAATTTHLSQLLLAGLDR